MKHRHSHRSVHVLLLFAALLVTVAAFTACGPSTPEEILAAATAAMDEDDHEQAYTLFQDVLDGKGEGEPCTEDQRFLAAFESSKCLVQLDRTDEAVAAFVSLEKSFPDAMNRPDAHKFVLQMCHPLIAEDDTETDRILDLVEYGKAKYPDQEAGFREVAMTVIEKARERAEDLEKAEKGAGLTAEQIRRLKQMGYF